jgi:hypothetical protein
MIHLLEIYIRTSFSASFKLQALPSFALLEKDTADPPPLIVGCAEFVLQSCFSQYSDRRICLSRRV